MITIDQIRLTPSQRSALAELRRRLSGAFGIQSISLYGSIARGEADGIVPFLVEISHGDEFVLD